MSKILIIDDERAIRNTLKEILEFENYTVETAENGKTGIQMAQTGDFDLIYSDIKMPEADGMEVLGILKQPESAACNVPVVMISGHGNIETAVEAIKKGAFDFIEKPIDLNRLLVTTKNALAHKDLNTALGQKTEELKKLKTKVAQKYRMVGDSAPIERVREIIEKVAPTEARVLITGENGTGKEVAAHLLHEQSNRAAAPLVEVNCAAIPSELIESELFGHMKGSFTGAVKDRAGKFEQADGGTLFLDEIGDMSLAAQTKVLRALQENEITRVGSDKTIKVNVRVIAATNKDLQQEIERYAEIKHGFIGKIPHRFVFSIPVEQRRPGQKRDQGERAAQQRQTMEIQPDIRGKNLPVRGDVQRAAVTVHQGGVLRVRTNDFCPDQPFPDTADAQAQLPPVLRQLQHLHRAVAGTIRADVHIVGCDRVEVIGVGLHGKV